MRDNSPTSEDERYFRQWKFYKPEGRESWLPIKRPGKIMPDMPGKNDVSDVDRKTEGD